MNLSSKSQNQPLNGGLAILFFAGAIVVVGVFVAWMIFQQSETKDHVYSEISVAITSRNEIWIDRRIVKQGNVREEIQRLERENQTESVLVIYVDKDASMELIETVADAARSVGIRQIKKVADDPTD